MDLPPGFSSVANALSEPNRSLVMIDSQVYDESAMSDLRKMLEEPRTDADEESTAPSDADTATRRRLAEYFAPLIKRQRATYPWLNDPGSRSAKGAATLESTMVESLRELYNPAQLEVLYRADLIIKGKTDERRTPLTNGPIHERTNLERTNLERTDCERTGDAGHPRTRRGHAAPPVRPPVGHDRRGGQQPFHTLAGAMLVDLALQGRIDIDERTTLRGREVRTVAGDPPADPLLRDMWDRIARKPVDVHSLILEIGPRLRQPVIDRVVERGTSVARAAASSA